MATSHSDGRVGVFKETANVYAGSQQDEEVGLVNKADPLTRGLRGRHMQMIAIGKGARTLCLLGRAA